MEAPETVTTFMEDGCVSVTVGNSLGLFQALPCRAQGKSAASMLVEETPS